MLYNRSVLKTTVFEAAEALGWDMHELHRRSGIPYSTLYAVRLGTRNPGNRFVTGAKRAFPHLSYEQLFTPVDATNVPTTVAHRRTPRREVQQAA